MNIRRPLVACALLIVLSFLQDIASRSVAAPLDNWLWSNPMPQGNSLYAVCHGNGQYVAVGEFGTILISSNGANWNRCESGTFDTLNACAYAAGRFVVVGNFGTVLTSTDGQYWEHQFAPTFYDLKGVAFGKGQFVAVGRQGTILTSPDAITWTQRASGPIHFAGVAFGIDLFVAVAGNAILTSADGLSWIRRPASIAGTLLSITYGDGKFIAVGGAATYEVYDYLDTVAVSNDGMAWTSSSFGAAMPLRGAAFGDGRWVAVAAAAYTDPYGWYEVGGMVFTSTNLAQWTMTASNTTPLFAVLYGASRFVGVSYEGSVLTSSIGLEWNNPLSASSDVPHVFSDLKHLNGSFVGMAGDRVSFSPDGVTWTNTHVFTTNRYGNELFSIAYGNGIYVGGGEYQRMWISPDAHDWTQVAPELDVANYVADVRQVIFANDLFMAVSGYSGNVLFSSNGINWRVKSVRTNSQDYFQSAGIAWGAGTCVVIGGGSFAVSSDLTNWTRIVPATYVYLTSITFANGRFVAVGDGAIFSSSDGTNWFSRASVDFGALTDVAFGDGYFVAVGGQSESSLFLQRRVWVSTNGLDWSARELNTPRVLSRIAFGGGAFVATGERSVILRCAVTPAQPALGLSMVQGKKGIVIKGIAGRSYRIEWASDCSPGATWSTLATVIASDGTATFTETNSDTAQRFYRAALEP